MKLFLLHSYMGLRLLLEGWSPDINGLWKKTELINGHKVTERASFVMAFRGLGVEPVKEQPKRILTNESPEGRQAARDMAKAALLSGSKRI